MTQYFFDFRDARPGAVLPPGLVRWGGGAVPSDFYHSFAPDGDGIIDWSRNTPSGSAVNSEALTYGPGVSAADVECLVKLVGITYNGTAFANGGPSFFSRIDNPLTSYTRGYEMALAASLGVATTFARRRVASTNTALSGTAGGISRTNTPVWIRWQIAGSTLRVRTWADGASEPETWGQTWTDSNVTAPGTFFFGMPAGGGAGSGSLAGRRYKIFQLSFGTNGDAAPSSRTRVVAGTLLKPDSSPAEGYLVRCYSRASGALIDETLTSSTGAFTFTIANDDKVYCVGVDQLGNTWRAPIVDLVSPVAP